MRNNTETLGLFRRRITLSTAFGYGMRLCAEWLERTRQRHQLAQFDERMLRDIGIRRSDVVAETTKPFWRT